MTAGDQSIRDVYDAIRSNDRGWNSTVLLVVWDEHGGLFDHEIPPAVLPDGFASTAPPFAFDRLGVRVPAVFVSPYIDQLVDHTVYEHASIPATVTEQFLGDPKTQSPYARERNANTFSNLLTRDISQPRNDTPGFDAAPPAAVAPPRATAGDPVNSLQMDHVRAIHAVLQRNHPALAKDLHPEAVATEGDANAFVAKALEAIHPDPS